MIERLGKLNGGIVVGGDFAGGVLPIRPKNSLNHRLIESPNLLPGAKGMPEFDFHDSNEVFVEVKKETVRLAIVPMRMVVSAIAEP